MFGERLGALFSGNFVLAGYRMAGTVSVLSFNFVKNN